MLLKSVEMAVKTVEGIDTAYVNLVFHPSWNQTMMSEEAKLELGLM